VLRWVTNWTRLSGQHPRYAAGNLAFAPIDDGAIREPPSATLEVRNKDHTLTHTWVMAEAWWAFSVRPASFTDIMDWAKRHATRVLTELQRAADERWQRVAAPEEGMSHDAQWVRRFNFLNAWVVSKLLMILNPFAVGLLYPLALLAQVPIPALQNFIAMNILRRFLTINAGQFRSFLDDDIQAANMRRRFTNTLHWLVNDAQCDEVYVLAHSEGAVIAFDALTRNQDPQLVSRVRKLLTFGAGLNKTWLLGKDAKRLAGPLPPHIYWVDFWTAYDFIPAGALKPVSGLSLYCPSTEVASWASPSEHATLRKTWNSPKQLPLPARYAPPTGGPITEEITGRMELVEDHGEYWHNDEEFVARVAQEIDADRFWDSAFWPGQALHGALAQRRWERLSILVAFRLATGVLALLNIEAVGPHLPQLGQALWNSIRGLPGLDRLVAPVPDALHSFVATHAPVLVSPLELICTGLFAAGVIALLFRLSYDIGVRAAWQPHDAQERQRALARMTGLFGGPVPSHWTPPLTMWAASLFATLILFLVQMGFWTAQAWSFFAGAPR
jgi:hypothetical protein